MNVYANVEEEIVQVMRWNVVCPEHGELLVLARDRAEAEDKRFSHNVAYHPDSFEARFTVSPFVEGLDA